MSTETTSTSPSAPALTVYGADWCGDCRRSTALLDRLEVDYTWKDLEQDAAATERAREISGRTNIPVVHFADGVHLVEPSDAELEEQLRSHGLLG